MHIACGRAVVLLGVLFFVSADWLGSQSNAARLTSQQLQLHARVEWELLATQPVATIARNFASRSIVKRVLELSNLTGAWRPWKQNTNIVHSISPFAQDDPAIAYMREELSRHVSLPLTHFEPLIIGEIRPGMTCKKGTAAPHFDWICPAESHHNTSGLFSDDNAVACPNARLVTAILYLNTLASNLSGGRTILPKLNLSVAPRAGALFAFRNVNVQGRKEAWASHFGECLQRRTESPTDNLDGAEDLDHTERKLVAVQYIRASPYDINVPDQAPEFYDFSYIAKLDASYPSSLSGEEAGNPAAEAHARAWRALRETWKLANYKMKTGPS